MTNNDNQLVIFWIAKQKYAVPVGCTNEIIRMVDITPLPQTNDYVLGIINLRGKVIPVINLHRKMGLPEQEKNKDNRIIVIENEGKNMGMVVDRVDEVSKYNEEELGLVDVEFGDNPFVKNIVKRNQDIWLILDLEVIVH
ncbi:MAG: hypothetical protein VR67_06590 [Peptococcaceae bacterium BRH_c8a]|nr:MAG: hypothetical protein VR67_06590 [Peptococcaceae bacterium BRH_c8a]